jgi:endonuclease/exonuclease/phosphatase (EEP) superfamily protein YafD
MAALSPQHDDGARANRAAETRAAETRAAVAGAAAALGGALLVVGVTGLVGVRLASQTLLANAGLHSAALSAAFWMLAAAVGWRRLSVAGLLLATAVVAATLAGPRWRATMAAPPESPRLTLLTFNMLYENPTPLRVVEWLETARPDVVALQEAQALKPHLSRIDALYPHRLGCEVECDLVILSRLPVLRAKRRDLPRAPRRMVSALVSVDGMPLWVHAVHWSRGFFGDSHVQTWATNDAVRAHRADGAPFVVAGDFNAAPWDPWLTTLMRQHGLAHPSGWRPTWPLALGPFGWPIDHVLTPSAVAVETIAALDDALGSNHRGVLAGIAILQ